MKKITILGLGLAIGTGVGLAIREVVSRKERKLLNELLFMEEGIKFVLDLIVETGKHKLKEEKINRAFDTRAYKEVLDDYSKIRYLVASIIEYGLTKDILKDMDYVNKLRVKYINNCKTRTRLLDQTKKEIEELTSVKMG